MEGKVQPIGEILFKKRLITVYNDPYTNESPGACACSWRMRNPDSCYTGIMLMNTETGEISYPEGAVIPKQTAKDREILPYFIVTSYPELTDYLVKEFRRYLKKEYKRRNPKHDK